MVAKQNRRTLNVSNALIENLLEVLGALELLLNLGDDGFGEFTLLPLLDLALVANPRVENGLGLCGNSCSLLHLESLCLKLGCLLCAHQLLVRVVTRHHNAMSLHRPSLRQAYLGDLEKVLGDVDDTTEVLDAFNALLDSGGVVRACGIENA